jgi:hypothetical protein
VRYDIQVINLSMTSTVPESYHTSLLAVAAEHAWFNGILVVVAAGNRGPDSMYYAPADDPFVVTVGATDSNGTVKAADDWIAPWSTSGSNPDGVTKPDVVAPGCLIVSTLAPGSDFQQDYPDRVVDRNYIWMVRHVDVDRRRLAPRYAADLAGRGTTLVAVVPMIGAAILFNAYGIVAASVAFAPVAMLKAHSPFTACSSTPAACSWRPAVPSSSSGCSSTVRSSRRRTSGCSFQPCFRASSSLA